MGSDSSKRAEETAQQDMKRMAEEIAQLRKEMMADEIAQRDKERMVKRSLILEYPHHLIMDTGSLESIDSGVSLKSDQSKDEPFDFKDRVSPTLVDFDSDVSAVKVLKRIADDLRAERRPQLRKERMVKRSLILEYPHHLIMDTGSLESIDSGVSLKSDQSKDELFDFKDRVSPTWVDSFLSEKKHNVTYVEDWIKSSDSQKRSSKECGVSFKSDGSKDVEYLKKKHSFATVRLRKFLSSGITSCLSVRMNYSQGCTADVKDTPPSPKEKPDDLIGPDIDPVGDHDDLMTERNRLSIESIDSGVSLKSDWSKLDCLISKTESLPGRTFLPQRRSTLCQMIKI